MRYRLRRYDTGGNSYTGMTMTGNPTLPTTSMVPNQLPMIESPQATQTFQQRPSTSNAKIGSYLNMAAGAASGITPMLDNNRLDKYALKKAPELQATQGVADTVGSVIPYYAASKSLADLSRAGSESAMDSGDQAGTRAGAFFQGTFDGFGTRMNLINAADKGVISESDNAGAQVLSTFLGPGFSQMWLSDQEAAYKKEKAAANAHKTNVGGTSGLDGRTYQRGNVMLARGGMAPQANAELEGGEIVESPDGDEYVKGPSHAQGGVPMNLNEGDYVWSDQIEYKGKTMAEWYQAFKQNGAGKEQIEQLRQLQESLAGRHNGEPGGERMALGGYGEDPGKPSKAGTFFKSTLPNWFDKTFNKGRKEASMDMQKRASAPVAAKRSDVMAENTQRSLSDEEKLAQDSYLMSASQERLRQSAQGTAPQYNPAEAYNADLTQKREQAQTPASQGTYGQRSKFSQISEEYAPYAIAGLGAIAQLAATASARNPYENVKMPIAQQAMNPTPVHLTRVSDTAQQAGLARDYRAGLDQMERSGAGPGSAGLAQRLLNERLQRGSEVMQRTAQINAPIDAQEQMYNSQSLAENERFNAAQRQQNNQSRVDLQVGKGSFDANKAMAIGDVFSGMARDTLGYMGEREKTRAIYGNSGIDQRNREYSMRQAYSKLKAAYPSLPETEIQKLLNEDVNKQFGAGK